MGDSKRAALLLKKQLKELQKNPVEWFSAGLIDDNILEWQIMIVGPQDTLYEGGFFNCTLKFPPDYPLLPPAMAFQTDIWHPNVYADGGFVYLFCTLLEMMNMGTRKQANGGRHVKL